MGGKIPDIAGFMDSDWGGNCDDQQLIGAYVFRMGDGAVSWKMKKQTSIALSSVEAEYMAMCQAAKEAVWLTGLLNDFGIGLQAPMILFSDNQGALALTHTPVFHLQSKHIDIQYHYTHKCIQNGLITVEYIPTKVMIADVLTKSLPWPHHIALMQMMGILGRN